MCYVGSLRQIFGTGSFLVKVVFFVDALMIQLKFINEFHYTYIGRRKLIKFIFFFAWVQCGGNAELGSRGAKQH